MNKPPKPTAEYTKDGRMPILIRVQPRTVRRYDQLARRHKLSRAAMMQLALDGWEAAK
jgi:predicted transcriptional regulator